MLLEGSRLGRYQLLRQVSSGGMGTIFLAQDSHMPRQVAVKVVRIDSDLQQNSASSQQMERPFYREIEAISRLDHPHILPIFDFGKEKIDEATYIYLVMPFRAEGSLAEWLRNHQSNERLSVAETAVLLLQAAEALQHAHDHGIVHQDVKPSNFLLRSRTSQPDALPDLLLTDFGIAQFLTSASSQSHAVRGTPLFMAPEQWDGHAIPASDQYALAIMAFRLLTGQFPFQGGPVQIMRQHCTTPPLAPSTLNPQLSLAVDGVIMRALAKQASDRFPSILEFAQAFEHALQSPGDLQSVLVSSPPVSPTKERDRARRQEANDPASEKPQSKDAQQFMDTPTEIAGQGSPLPPTAIEPAARVPSPAVESSPQAQAIDLPAEPKARFRLPFYSEDTPMDMANNAARNAMPVTMGAEVLIDRPLPLRNKLPYKMLLIGLIVLVVLGSGVLLFQNISHSLNLFAAGTTGTQTVTTLSDGQVQTPLPGSSTSTGHTGTQVALPGADPGVGGNQPTPGAKSTPVPGVTATPQPGVTPSPTPTSTPRPVPTPTPKPVPTPTPKPVSNLPPPPGGSALTSTAFPTTRWWVSTFGTAPGYRGGWTQVGVLYGNTNYVFCKAWGAVITDSSGNFNHWWMWTDLDTGGGQGWVSAYYLSKWGNDVAKDNSGNVLPDC